MKLGRWEVGLGGGFVTNDPFINRYILRGDGTGQCYFGFDRHQDRFGVGDRRSICFDT